jgi:hypothetical protein
MENEVNKNSGWPGFFQSNNPLAWFVVVMGALFIGYLLLSGAIIEGCGVVIKPQTEKNQDDLKEKTDDAKISEQTQPEAKDKKNNSGREETKLPKGDSQRESTGFLFTGIVVDEAGPVPNVKVVCESKEGLTDAAGIFRILLEQDPGNQDKLVSLFKEGYSSHPYQKRNNETYLFPRK